MNNESERTTSRPLRFWSERVAMVAFELYARARAITSSLLALGVAARRKRACTATALLCMSLLDVACVNSAWAQNLGHYLEAATRAMEQIQRNEEERQRKEEAQEAMRQAAEARRAAEAARQEEMARTAESLRRQEETAKAALRKADSEKAGAEQLLQAKRRELENLKIQKEDEARRAAIQKEDEARRAALMNPWQNAALSGSKIAAASEANPFGAPRDTVVAPPAAIAIASESETECDCDRIRSSCTPSIRRDARGFDLSASKVCAQIGFVSDGQAQTVVLVDGSMRLEGAKGVRVTSCKVCQAVVRPTR